MKGFVIYPTYRIINNKPYVVLYGRLENGESFVSINSFKPYFYIKKKDLKHVGGFEIEDSKMKDFAGDEVVKIIVEFPADVLKIRKEFEDLEVECFEADIKFAQRFLMDKGIQGSIKIDGDYIYSDRVDRIYQEPEVEGVEYVPHNLKILSFDIESGKGDRDDELYCISLVCDKHKKSFIIGKASNAVSCKDEEELLEKFIAEILELDPDIITGWNVIDFDLNYLNEKFKKYKIPFDVGREPAKAKLRIEENFFRKSKIDIVGRQVIDGLELLKVSFIKVEDYKLDTVANAILGEGKLIHSTGIDKYKEIDNLWKKDKKGLIEYNLKDAELVIRILAKSKVLELTILRSLLTGMPLDRVDASIASFDSLYIRKANKRGLVVPTGKYGSKEERIKGGYVKESLPGIYNYLLILDFKSLYPSMMRTFNIDPYSYEPECHGKNLIKAPNGACFRNEDGILPQILKELWAEREVARKNKDVLTKHAIKILMNSFFGILANPASRFFDVNLANSITHFGQHILKLTHEEIKKLGYNVIYGDSVTGDTELILQNEKGEVYFDLIKNLYVSCKKKAHDGKSYDFPKNLKVLTIDLKGKSVFKDVSYVVKHFSKKKIYRIYFTNSSFIEVTEDHSLIGYINDSKISKLDTMQRLKEVKPLEIGKRINSIISLKKIPRKIIKSKNYPKEVYEFMGYFVGDGSFRKNKIHKKDNKDYYLGLSAGNDYKDIIKKIIIPLQKLGYIRSYSISKSRKGDLTINGLKLVKLITEELRENNIKIVPKFLYYEHEKNISSFLRGLFSADGTVIIRNNNPIVRFTNTRVDIIKNSKMLLNFVGISNSYFTENKPNKYKGKISKTYSSHIVIKDILGYKKEVGFIIKRKQEMLNVLKYHPAKKNYYSLDFDISKVVRIEEINNNQFVYDIEVDKEHRFFANNVLVHNTDSNFVVSKAKNLTEANKIGKEIQDHINNFYKKLVKKEYNRESFLELNYEKCFVKCLMPKLRKSEAGAKKRYAGLIIKNGKEELQFTGMEFARGDWTDIAKEYQYEIINRLFHNKEIVVYTKKIIEDIKKGKYDDKLVYKKHIRKELEEYTKNSPPHVKAARQLKSLESNKIEYVITENGPEPIQLLKHKIDYEHYINKQIKPIAETILVLFNKNFDEIIKGSKQTSLFGF